MRTIDELYEKIADAFAPSSLRDDEPEPVRETILPARDTNQKPDQSHVLKRFLRNLRHWRRGHGRPSLEQRLRAAEAVSDAKSRHIATVVHEIRTPLNGILGMAHLLGQTQLTAEQQNYLSGIRQSGHMLAHLVDDILDLSTMEAGRFRLNTRAENLRQLIESVVEMLAYRAHEKRIEIAATFAADLPERLDFDPARLRQVLFNVIGNAVKFTFEGGVLVRASVRDGNVAIEVEDTGPGMTEEERRRIFADFEQVGLADARSGGTGLGLGIASRILAEFGGALAVRSTKGQGSVFTIRFPVQLGEDAPAGMVDRRRLLSTSRVLLLAPPGPSATATVATIEALGGRCRHVVAAEQVQLLIDRADRGPAPFTDLIVDHRAACDYADASRHRPLHRILLVNPEERASQPQDLFDAWLIRPLREKSLIDVLSGRLRGFGNGRSVAPDQQADLKSKEDGPAAGGLDIILAEDDPVSATLVKAMLHKNGHRVNWVDDVPRFVAALREPGARADLLITDMNMPGGDPLEALASLRRETVESALHAVPVLVMTGSAIDAEERARLASMGCHLVMKPVVPGDLLALADRLAGAGQRRQQVR